MPVCGLLGFFDGCRYILFFNFQNFLCGQHPSDPANL